MTIPSKVLCVDDDPVLLRSVARALSMAPELVVETAATAAEARERLVAGDCAVLLTDYEMPGENGVALIESLEPHCDVVSILLTGRAELDVALEAINRGHVYALLRKPIQTQELILTVRRAAERFALGRALHDKIDELEHANQALSKRNEELRRAREELERLQSLTSTDAKTGVHSFRFLQERLDEEVARATRYDHPLSLLLLDLDGFKAANDRLGHLGGDQLLKAVAELLQAQVRVMDVVARFGGDEFAVMLPSTSMAGAAVLAERLRATIAAAAMAGTRPGEVTVSVGIASMPYDPVETGRQLLEEADRALYEAKHAGKNRCVLANPPTITHRRS